MLKEKMRLLFGGLVVLFTMALVSSPLVIGPTMHLKQTAEWPTTPGTIKSMDSFAEIMHHKTVTGVTLKYTYDLNGAEHQGTETFYCDKVTVEGFVKNPPEEFRVGSAVTVSHNPSHADRSSVRALQSYFCHRAWRDVAMNGTIMAVLVAAAVTGVMMMKHGMEAEQKL